MSQAYVIEIKSCTAGIVVRDGRHFQFFAASHDFNDLEGQTFKSPKEAEKAALRFVTQKGGNFGQRPHTIHGAQHR